MKRIIAFCLVVGSAIGLMAESITPSQALNRLKKDSQVRKIAARHVASPQLIAELPELYVFSSGDGFMILPADDIALPLLGYADSGEFDPEQIPALKWWLSTYSEQIARAAGLGVTDLEQTAGATERKPIEPLLKTTWNQDAPYNDLMPELNGRKCYTGCVATAMAQVMKYHKWPAQGQGEISYTWSTGNQTLSMDFSDVTFDWDNMADSYSTTNTTTQNLAVATLMKACGYSVKMNYSTDGSGAYPVYIGGALIDYFNYDKGIRQPQRDSYELAEWEDLIYADLAAGLPVIYGGQSTNGGHQFVCDGYSTDGFFHFNWGWGGMSDGYFKLNALNPGSLGIGAGAGGYNMDQSVTLGVQPPVEGSEPAYELTAVNDFTPTTSTVQLGGYAMFNCGVFNYGAVTIPAGTEIDIEFTPTEGGDPVYVNCTKTAKLTVNLGYSSLYALLPTSMAEGTYTARLVFRVPDGEWLPVQTSLAYNSELTATVEGNKMTFVAENQPGFTIADLPQNPTIYIGAKFSLSITLTNKSSKEYIGSMNPIIIQSDSDEEIGWGSSTPIELAGGQTLDYDYVGTLSPKAGTTFTPGSYRLYFLNMQTNKPICDPIPITLAEKPTDTKYEVTDLKFLGIQPGDIAKFSMTVTCTEGYFDESFLLVIWNKATGSSVIYKSISLLLNQGESKEVTCEIPLGDIDFGEYYATAYDGGSITPREEFSYLEHSTSSIENVTSEEANSAVYDLQGRKVSMPAPGQLYIRGGKLLRL